MANNRIRIGKQTELSTTPRSVVVTDSINEQQYVPPGINGDLFTIVSGVPTWQAPIPFNNLLNLSNIMGAVAITETPANGDTTTFRNGLHLAVVATDNQVMWGGNLSKNTTIGLCPNVGDGASAVGYTVLFDGVTGTTLGSSNPRFVVNLQKNIDTTQGSIVTQLIRNAIITAKNIPQSFSTQYDGTGISGVNTFIGSENNTSSVLIGGNYRNWSSAVTNTFGHEYQGVVLQGNWAGCINHALPDICGATCRTLGTSSNTSTIPWRADLYLSNVGGGGAVVGTVTQSRGLVINSRDGISANQANIHVSDSANFANPFNSRSSVAITGLWNMYSDTTRNSWHRGNTMLGGAVAVAPSFLLELSTDSAAKPTTSTWTIASDIDTKENIVEMDGKQAVNIIKAMPALISFNYKKEVGFGEEMGIGWSAQDIEKVPLSTKVVKEVFHEHKDNSEYESYIADREKFAAEIENNYKEPIENEYYKYEIETFIKANGDDKTLLEQKIKELNDIGVYQYYTANEYAIKVANENYPIDKVPQPKTVFSQNIKTINIHEINVQTTMALKEALLMIDNLTERIDKLEANIGAQKK